MFEQILSATDCYHNDAFDYRQMATKISEFEVNGFMDKEYVREFNCEVNHLVKICKIILPVMILTVVICWLIA